MDNIAQIKEFILSLEGVNPDPSVIEQSMDKHFASISDVTVEQLADVADIYKNYGVDIVNKDLNGIINYTMLARSPEEAITYCEANSYGSRRSA